LYKGGELLAAGKVVEAKDHLERAFKLHPKNEKAQNLLGLTYFKLGLFDRAAEIYELLVRENPADPTLRVNLGLVYLKTNNLPRAVKEFETSTDLEPTHKKAHNYLGLALAQSGDYARAREHFLIAGSDAMVEKMARAISAGAAAPVAVTPAPPPSAPPAPVPTLSPPSLLLHAEPAEVISTESLGPPPPGDSVVEVTSEDVLPPDTEIVPAEALLKSKPRPVNPDAVPLPGAGNGSQPSAVALAEAAAGFGGADKGPLPDPGYEEMPAPQASSSKALLNDWGAQFGMDDSQPAPADEAAPAQPAEEEMRFAEDEGPSAMPMPSLSGGDDVVATSEAAVATGAQVPVEVVERSHSAETWDAMPVVEATAEEVMVEVDPAASAPVFATVIEAPSPSAPIYGEEITEPAPSAPLFVEVVEPAPSAPLFAVEVVPPAPSAPTGYSDVGLSAAADQVDTPPPEPTEIPPGLSYSSDAPTYAPVEPSAAYDSYAASGEPAPVEMFPSAPADDPYATQEAWPTSDGTSPDASSPEWLTGGAAHAPSAVSEAPSQFTGEVPPDPLQVPITGEVPTAPTDMAMSSMPASGYAPMVAPRLEELGPSQALTFTPGELSGPFNLSPDGLALSVNGELLSRLPGLLAVVGSIDATPENKRSRGRTIDQGFGQGDHQLQRVRGNGLIHLDPQGARYQAIDLADEGAYVREERVFAFEEAVAFENARLTGQGTFGVDVVHLKGQGKVLLKLEGALKAMQIPPGTPLKVPLARLVGWYGYVSVRVMGFVGQGAVELTGDGYVLLAA
jgi:hypothetical protein